MARKENSAFSASDFNSGVFDEARRYRSLPRVENPRPLQDQLRFEYADLLNHLAEQAKKTESFRPGLDATAGKGGSGSLYHASPAISMGIAIHEAMERHFSKTGKLKSVLVLDAEHGSYTVEPDKTLFLDESYRVIPLTGKSVMSAAIINGDIKPPSCQDVSVAGMIHQRHDSRLHLWADQNEALRSIPYFIGRNWFTKNTGIQPGTKRWTELMQEIRERADQRLLHRPRPLDTRLHPWDASGSMRGNDLGLARKQISGIDDYLIEDTETVYELEQPSPAAGWITGFSDLRDFRQRAMIQKSMISGDYHFNSDKED